MSKRYTIEKNKDFVFPLNGLHREDYLVSFTELEVRELASQLPVETIACLYRNCPIPADELDTNKIKSVSHIFDRADKPDPIESVEIREYGDLKVYSDDEVAEKVNEIIEHLNSLSQYE